MPCLTPGKPRLSEGGLTRLSNMHGDFLAKGRSSRMVPRGCAYMFNRFYTNKLVEYNPEATTLPNLHAEVLGVIFTEANTGKAANKCRVWPHE